MRLTSNKEVSEMGMFELAHNSSYKKEGNARYRDYKSDIDARELAKRLLDKFADIPNEFTCDDDFDEFMMDALQYGTDNILGLIALFYRNLWAMADLRETLRKYEDQEEQGQLLKLPCKVGGTVYILDRNGAPRRMILDPPEIRCHCAREDNMCPDLCDDIKAGICAHRLKPDGSDLGKTAFLTRREAEEATQKGKKEGSND